MTSKLITEASKLPLLAHVWLLDMLKAWILRDKLKNLNTQSISFKPRGIRGLQDIKGDYTPFFNEAASIVASKLHWTNKNAPKPGLGRI